MISNSIHRTWLGRFKRHRFAILGILILSGCADSGPTRFAITGEVTLDGKPVEDASIVLTPERGGLGSVGKIVEGQFSIAQEYGPTQGEFNVRINPDEAELEEFAASPQPHQRTHQKRQIPKIYQANGRLTAVVSDREDQVLKFELSSREH
jgi:hypothetical protein